MNLPVKTQNYNGYLKCHLLSIDAWRYENGWSWNNWYTLEENIFIPEGLGNRELIRFFRENLNVLSDYSKGRVEIDDDGYNIVVCNRNTHEPLFALCYGEYL